MCNHRKRRDINIKKAFGGEFTLAIGCKLNCKYCPQEKLVHQYIKLFGKDKLTMEFEDFKTCLSKIEKGAGIAITGMVEPFHNKECAKMIRYAYEEGYKVTLATSLEGAVEEDYELLKGVKFEGLLLHIPDAEENSKFSLSEQYFDIFNKFNKEFPVDLYSCHGRVHEAIRPHLDPKVTISNGMNNRAGNLEDSNLESHNHTGALVCGLGGGTGWSPEILPNGTVVLCCMDYGMEHILGNLLEQDWGEIVEGSEYRKFESGLEDESIPLLCRQCAVALKKEAASYKLKNLLGSHAIKVARLIKSYINGEITKKELEGRFSKSEVITIRKLVNADTVCVFGIGKIFEDNYFNSLWHNIIQADMFSDNDESKWNQSLHGVPIVPPQELKNFENLLVITYVRDDTEIRKTLEHIGSFDIISINDIFNLQP